MVFKLERERPASAFYQNNLFFITKEKHVRSYDFQKNIESPTLLTLKKLGSPWVPPRSLSYNPAERAILSHLPQMVVLTSSSIYLVMDLAPLMALTQNVVKETRLCSLPATDLLFSMQQANKLISRIFRIRPQKPSKPPTGTTDIYFGGTGNLLLITPTAVHLYDIQQKKSLQN